MTKYLFFITALFVYCLPLYAKKTPEININQLRKSIILGDVRFHTLTTNSLPAKEHFLLGLSFLHAFMYELAIEQFKKAKTIDPGFAMSYWGEAMAHKHVIWNYEDLSAAQNVLSQYKKNNDQRQLTIIEKRYMESARILFSHQSLLDRDTAYTKYMGSFHEDYPQDPNISAFYALSLLGLASDFPREQVGEVNLKKGRKLINDFYQKFPNHPGIVHYYIHYHDVNDLELAKKALPAAKKVLTLMRSSSHVVHMAAHIYRRLGLWDEYNHANKSSIEAADKLCKKLNSVPLYACNAHNKYHSLEWLQYGYLKTGQTEKAQHLLKRMEKVVSQDHSIIYKQWYYRMWARQSLLSKDSKLPLIEIDPITQLDSQLYWSAYSECGALLASSFLLLEHQKPIQKQLRRLNKLITYTDKIQDPYIKQTCQIVKLQMLAKNAAHHNNKKMKIFYLNQALKLQSQMVSSHLTPSLPFLPVSNNPYK